MIEEIRAQVGVRMGELDGVVALRQTQQDTAPYLFQSGDNLSQLVIDPRYPLARNHIESTKTFSKRKVWHSGTWLRHPCPGRNGQTQSN